MSVLIEIFKYLKSAGDGFHHPSTVNMYRKAMCFTEVVFLPVILNINAMKYTDNRPTTLSKIYNRLDQDWTISLKISFRLLVIPQDG